MLLPFWVIHMLCVSPIPPMKDPYDEWIITSRISLLACNGRLRFCPICLFDRRSNSCETRADCNSEKSIFSRLNDERSQGGCRWLSDVQRVFVSSGNYNKPIAWGRCGHHSAIKQELSWCNYLIGLCKAGSELYLVTWHDHAAKNIVA